MTVWQHSLIADGYPSARLKNWKAGVPQSTAQDKKPAGNRPSLNTFDLED